MKKLLLVFDYRYPYEPPTEQFLHTEIGYLLSKFDVMTIPIARGINDSSVYDFGRNLKVTKIERKARSIEGVIGFFSLIKNCSNLFVDLKNIKKAVDRAYKKKAVKDSICMYLQAAWLNQCFIHQIDKAIFDRYEDIVLYSYWMDATLIATIWYKKYLRRYFSKKHFYVISRAHGDGDLYQVGFERFRIGGDLINREVSTIFAISRAGQQYLNKQGINNARTSYLGVNNNKTNDCYEVTRKDRRQIIIVSCSVINDNKRVIDIARVMSKVNLNIRWIHFGGGEKEEFVRNWCNKNMPSNIEWIINGWTSSKDIMDYYEREKPDLFINLSKVEGIPVSIMEAYSYAIPAIATNVGATSEIVHNQRNGFLIEKEYSLDEIVELIYYFTSQDDSVINEYRNCAYLTWKESFNAESNYPIFRNMIDDLV